MSSASPANTGSDKDGVPMEEGLQRYLAYAARVGRLFSKVKKAPPAHIMIHLCSILCNRVEVISVGDHDVLTRMCHTAVQTGVQVLRLCFGRG